MENRNLSTLVHFYNDARHLFRTITMYSDEERERILDKLVHDRVWYWGRYSPEDRRNYLARRVAVEGMMYSEFLARYGKPPCKSPVYFYVFPEFSRERMMSHLQERRNYSEVETNYLLVQLAQLHDRTHISFTIEDSFSSYREALEEKGLRSIRPTKPRMGRVSGHGRLFSIDELESVYKEFRREEGLVFEVQIWDHEILRPVWAEC